MNLCVTTTAMPRPELIEQTYKSFVDNLIGINWDITPLIINIDSFPDKKNEDKILQVKEVCEKYFKNIQYNVSGVSNFSLALKTIWSSVDSSFVLNLEDDWELRKKIHISDIAEIFDKNDVDQVALRAYPSPSGKFCLSPAFTKASICRDISSKIVVGDNPEIQIRNMGYVKTLMYPESVPEVILKDLGRSWMLTKRYNRGERHWNAWSCLLPGKNRTILKDQNKYL